MFGLIALIIFGAVIKESLEDSQGNIDKVKINTFLNQIQSPIQITIFHPCNDSKL